jgi:hypothetical protein
LLTELGIFPNQPDRDHPLQDAGNMDYPGGKRKCIHEFIDAI